MIPTIENMAEKTFRPMLTYDDEAHRIQRSSNYMGDKKNEQTYLSMVMSLLYCAKICVFFIDDHQGVKKEV